MTFADWLIRQFVGFNVLTMVVIVLFNYFTTTRAVNRQMKEQKLYEELQEIKDAIGQDKK
jgi:preprotein translocase subunit YajC